MPVRNLVSKGSQQSKRRQLALNQSRKPLVNFCVSLSPKQLTQLLTEFWIVAIDNKGDCIDDRPDGRLYHSRYGPVPLMFAGTWKGGLFIIRSTSKVSAKFTWLHFSTTFAPLDDSVTSCQFTNYVQTFTFVLSRVGGDFNLFSPVH